MANIFQLDGTTAILQLDAVTPITELAGSSAPTITSFVPNYGYGHPDSEVTLDAVLAGTNFNITLSGGPASLTFSGSGVSAEDVVIHTASLITFHVAISIGAAIGPRTLTVATDGGTATATFTVMNPAAGGGGGTHEDYRGGYPN